MKAVILAALVALCAAPAPAQQPSDTFETEDVVTDATNHPTLRQIIDNPRAYMAGSSSIALDDVKVSDLTRQDGAGELPVFYTLAVSEERTGAYTSSSLVFPKKVVFAITDASIVQFVRQHPEYSRLRARLVFAPIQPLREDVPYAAKVISITWFDSKGNSVTAR